jgi:hypothetical protein
MNIHTASTPPEQPDFAARVRYWFGIWFILRVLTLLWAAFVSPIRPITAREQTIALWPPSAPLGAWLERALLAPWERRDVVYYLSVTNQGYRLDDGTTQFHPLLAWLATPFTWVGMSPLFSLLLVSSAASLLLLPVFERLARCDQDARTAQTSTLLLLFSPLAFILFAPYTEGLFLLWAVLCLLWARQRAWWLAGLAGALATLTRQQGLFLLLPLAWELWQAADYDWRRALAAWKNWLALALIPLGMLLWIVYRALALADLNVDASSLQSLVYSVLISPSSSQVVPNQAFLWPWHALWLALEKLWRAPEYSLIIDLILGAGFLVLTAVAWKHMRLSYRIYTVVIILVSFSYYTGPFYPYMGLPRHLLLAFPVFIGLGPVFRRFRARLWMLTIGMLGMLFLLLQYVIEGWVP